MTTTTTVRPTPTCGHNLTGTGVCDPCWGRIPAHLRQAVMRTGRRKVREPASVDAQARYQDALTAALAGIA